jgi:two-component system response regulator HydG
MSHDKPVLLVVDDDPQMLDVLARFAERCGYEPVSAGSGRQAIDLLRNRRADLALVDLHMPDVGGLDVLKAVRETEPSCQVVLITAYPSVDTAVEAVKLGARDYLSKPPDFVRLERLLRDVRDDVERRRALLATEADIAERLEFHGMIGRGPAMQEVFAFIRRLAPHLRTALVTGETGTGKELVARALHAAGPRQARPFVAVNCADGGDTAFEIELFGCVAGAVPGAHDDRSGTFELADGGTVFLDEVGQLPLAVQARLLRLLEHGEVHRVGALDYQRVDVHVIAATSRDLREEVSVGHFRGDLFYRLNVVELSLPPLRDRREDVPYLTAAFIRATAARLGKTIEGITTAAESLLVSAPWAGNVRELRNVLERACLVCDGQLITDREIAASLPPPSRRLAAAAPAAVATTFAGEDPHPLAAVEREHILRALQRTGGNKKAAARMLGVSRRALYRRLERLDLGGTIARRRAARLSAGAAERSLTA